MDAPTFAAFLPQAEQLSKYKGSSTTRSERSRGRLGVGLPGAVRWCRAGSTRGLRLCRTRSPAATAAVHEPWIHVASGDSARPPTTP